MVSFRPTGLGAAPSAERADDGGSHTQLQRLETPLSVASLFLLSSAPPLEGGCVAMAVGRVLVFVSVSAACSSQGSEAVGFAFSCVTVRSRVKAT